MSNFVVEAVLGGIFLSAKIGSKLQRQLREGESHGRHTAVKRYETTQSEWDRIAASEEFKDLMATKKIFIVPAFVFFVVYYFALPVLVGYAPASWPPRSSAW